MKDIPYEFDRPLLRAEKGDICLLYTSTSGVLTIEDYSFLT